MFAIAKPPPRSPPRRPSGGRPTICHSRRCNPTAGYLNLIQTGDEKDELISVLRSPFSNFHLALC